MKTETIIKHFVNLVTPKKEKNKKPTSLRKFKAFLAKKGFINGPAYGIFDFCYVHPDMLYYGSSKLVVVATKEYACVGILIDKDTYDGGGLGTFDDAIDAVHMYLGTT